MPRLALKPDSSFFRKIAIGAVGTRAISADLAHRGHCIVELERGSLDTKLWKDVKRKRVRIPDLLCTRCGLRVESRAKTQAELSMSHSPTDAERAWDFGMVDTDLVAFPVCEITAENYWSAGRLGTVSSYWHERNWVGWCCLPHINYFLVRSFRSSPPTKSSTKGVTEGSETSIAWDATFSTRTGTAETIDGQRITIRRASDGHRYTWTVRPGQTIFPAPGSAVEKNQVIASSVRPLMISELSCPGTLPPGHIAQLLSSRERTQRFTGVKLARLRREREFSTVIEELTADQEEDVYIRLEGVSYMASVAGQSARDLFPTYLDGIDPQNQLEAVIALGETATAKAVEILSEILDTETRPYFVRSAAAWALSRIKTDAATSRLVRAFSDIDESIREEALEGIVLIGGASIPLLLDGLREQDKDIAAGAAEALRQQQPLSDQVLSKLSEEARSGSPSLWTVWLLGHLPRERVAGALVELQDSAPQLHYAISLLWSFVESWIARHWELNPGSGLPSPEKTLTNDV